MSTRVQKGGPKFKPVTTARNVRVSEGPSRNTSAAPERVPRSENVSVDNASNFHHNGSNEPFFFISQTLQTNPLLGHPNLNTFDQVGQTGDWPNAIVNHDMPPHDESSNHMDRHAHHGTPIILPSSQPRSIPPIVPSTSNAPPSDPFIHTVINPADEMQAPRFGGADSVPTVINESSFGASDHGRPRQGITDFGASNLTQHLPPSSVTASTAIDVSEVRSKNISMVPEVVIDSTNSFGPRSIGTVLPSGPQPKPKGSIRSKRATTDEVQGDNTNDGPVNNPSRHRTRSRSKIADNGNYVEREVQESRSKRRRRSTSKSSVNRRSRAPSLPPFDATADPGEELDPTVITMANICEDTGHGRISTKAVEIQRNHSSWKATNREKRARMRNLTEGKKYGRTEDDDGAISGTLNANAPTGLSSEQIGTGGEAVAGPSSSLLDSADASSEVGGQDDTGNGFNYSAPLSTNRFNVQVRIGPNGETIIDEETLYVDRANDPDLANEEYTHIEESDHTKFVNSQSYSRKQRGARWSAPETELFYDALSQFGENYELISYVLPGRDRKSCKNKFKAEDKKNPNRITYCLNNRVPYDIQTLSRMTGRDFSGPTPEIRVPEPRRLGDDVPSTQNAQPTKEDATSAVPAKKKSRTLRVNEEGVEVLGDIDTFEKDVEDLAASQSTLQ